MSGARGPHAAPFNARICTRIASVKEFQWSVTSFDREMAAAVMA